MGFGFNIPTLIFEEDCGGSGSPTNPPTPITLDAILKPRPIFTNGFETPGQVWKFGEGDQNTNASLFGTSASFEFGHENRFGGQKYGNFTFNPTGGRNGGGYLTTQKNTSVSHPGSYIAYNTDPATALRQAGIFGGFNLFGLIPPTKIAILGAGYHLSSPEAFGPAAWVNLNIDNTLSVAFIGDTEYFTGVAVPATGWWAVEIQIHEQLDINASTGFVLMNLYTVNSPAIGIPILRQIGCRTFNTGLGTGGLMASFAIGSDVTGLTGGMDGLGIDDFHIYDSTGPTKRFIFNAFTTVAVPTANGDSINSVNIYNTQIVNSAHNAPSNGAIPITQGLVTNHNLGGDDTQHWKNVNSFLNPRPYAEYLGQSSGDGSNIDIYFGEWFGDTNDWEVPGSPFVPGSTVSSVPFYLQGANFAFFPDLTPIPFGFGGSGIPFDVNRMENAWVRNTFQDDKPDLYQIGILTNNTLTFIEGIQPFVRTGVRTLVSGTFEIVLFGGFADLHTDAPDKTYKVPSDDDHSSNAIDRNERRQCRFLFKDVDGTWSGPIFNANSGGDTYWCSLPGFATIPYSFLVVNPNSNQPFTDADLSDPATQIGIRGDFTDYDADPTPLPTDVNHRYIRFDCAEIGIDILYRKDVINYVEHPLFPPIACLNVGLVNKASHIIGINDLSDDWDGTVVGVTIDWGDGSAIQSITPHSGVDHTYSGPGIYNITLIATDNDGLTDGVATGFINLFVPASASFTDTNPTGNEIDFTDTSSANDETISGWHWDFGDGNTSTSQNPHHTYAAPGTYTVVLTLTTNFSPAGTIKTSPDAITVPFPGAMQCAPSSDFMAADADVIGDDFHGDNNGVNYANTAAFDQIYEGGGLGTTHGRAMYQQSYATFNDGVEHKIDASHQFNSHQTYNMVFGVSGGNTYQGAGWEASFSNNAYPTEAFINVTKAWIRLRIDTDAGVVSETDLTDSEVFNGLEVFSIIPGDDSTFIEESIMVRNGSIFFDDQNNAFHSLGSQNQIIGAGPADILMLFDGTTQSAVRRAIWIAPACQLAGTSPKYDGTINYGSSGVLSQFLAAHATFGQISFLNSAFTPVGGLKNVWVDDWEMMPFSVDGNPFGVSGI